MKIDKVTPIRIVDRIETCLPFWCDSLGFEKRIEVPQDGALVFVLLEGPGGSYMMQTRSSLGEDIPSAAALEPDVVLYVEVPSLADAKQATRGARVLIDERTTDYGMRESVVVDPQGTVVIFAQRT
jgi:hypothetical protein